MALLNRYNTGIVIIILISVAFFTLYEPQYPVEVIQPFEINSPELDARVLIASQLSDYKNAIVIGLLRHLKEHPVFIKVIDVTALPGFNDYDWDAVVVIHTWENWAPPPAVETWFEADRQLDKIVVLTTSGNAQYQMGGINAITSASLMTTIPTDIEEILTRLNVILSRKDLKHQAPRPRDTWQEDYPPSFP